MKLTQAEYSAILALDFVSEEQRREKEYYGNEENMDSANSGSYG